MYCAENIGNNPSLSSKDTTHSYKYVDISDMLSGEYTGVFVKIKVGI